MEKKYKIKNSERRISLNCGRGNRHLIAEKRSVDEEISTHWHSYFELEIIIGGRAVHTLNGAVYNEERGSVYLLNPTDVHSVAPSETLTLYNISFDEEIISNKMLCELMREDSAKRFSPNEEVFSRLISLCELIEAESNEPDQGLSRELCECLLGMVIRNRKRANKEEILQNQATGIRKALLFMDLHFRENPTLSQVAAQAGFHPNYFSELFREVTGETFTTRLNTLRTGYAKTLLSSGFSVTEACYNSGFSSLSNFLVTFKRFVGISPEEFKRKYK